ncbi:hypothetical protein PLESTB_000691100 [Pleodorina starrii]|uniref:Uncharacterized protein n=1 Tax=Pleodorina starrii TaxID=330485 RepID=A0A9W6BIQ2_9CHLO|nr:hypothetical protein PLESTB_000691100 [Pleodorina starrii]
MTAAEHHIAAQQPSATGTAHGMMDDRMHNPVCQPFNLEAHGCGHVFHERRSSAPPPAALRLAGYSRRLQVNIQNVPGFESEGSVDSGAEEDEAESRMSGAVGPCGVPTPQERRRSSWAAGAFETFQPKVTTGGYEALPPDQLYQQFIQIRDAVLRKAGGQPGPRLDGAEGSGIATLDGERGSAPGKDTSSTGCDCSGAGTHGAGNQQGGDISRLQQHQGAGLTDCDRAAELQGEAATAAGMGMAPTTDAAPDSPYKSAVAIATLAASPDGRARRARASAFTEASGTFDMSEPQLAGGNGRTRRQPHQSPEMVDLQDYYRSPAASSCGAGHRTSPFEGAATNASDFVSYNELYGRAPATRSIDWPTAPSPYRTTSAKELVRDRPNCRPGAAAGTLEAVSSMPGTDSFFSLLPSGEPQPSVAASAGECTSQQRQPSLAVGCRANGVTASQVLVWQEDLPAKANGSASALKGDRSSGRSGALRPVDTASSSMRLSMHDSRSTNRAEDSEVEAAADSRGVDVVVRSGGRNGDEAFTPDYLKAVQSAAQRTLLPRSRAQSGSSIRSSGTSGLDCHALLSSGWAAVAAASNSATTPHTPAAQVGGSGTGEGVRPTYEGYVPLPLPGLPPPLEMPTASGPTDLPPPLAMHSTPSVAATTAAVVRKCLDKGLPLAVIPVKHFASVMAAAEQHDGPLAYHIISTHGVYYPGLGRHAASSGGGLAAAAFNGVVGVPGGSSSGPKAGAGCTPSKPVAPTAAATAAEGLRQLLAKGEALHIMSPSEYQRMQLAAQYSLRQLHEILVPQPSVFASETTGPTSAGLAAQERASNVAVAHVAGAGTPPPGGGGRVLRHHRRGSSICSESNFTAIVRFNSGVEGQGGGQDPAATPVRAGHSDSLSSAHDLTTPEGRVKALIQAAQLGNMARVAHLVKHGVDVHAVESAQQQQGMPHGVRGALAGAFTSTDAAAGGRTALHYAALAGSFGVAQLLLHHGAFVGVRDATGRTAYDLARRKGHDAVAQLLRDAAERRREVMRSSAAESRATAAAAPRTGYPPPVPPRAKQTRSNSAPASGAAVGGPLATAVGARSITDAAVVSAGAGPVTVEATVAAVVCAPVEQVPLPQPQSSSARDVRVCRSEGSGDACGETLVEYQLSGCTAAALGPTAGPSDRLPEVLAPAQPCNKVAEDLSTTLVRPPDEAPGFGTVQAPAAVGRTATSPEPAAHVDVGQVHRKGGLLGCCFCGAE